MLITNTFLSQEIIGTHKVAEESNKYKESIQATLRR